MFMHLIQTFETYEVKCIDLKGEIDISIIIFGDCNSSKKMMNQETISRDKDKEIITNVKKIDLMETCTTFSQFSLFSRV